jgi:hypothetical protein
MTLQEFTGELKRDIDITKTVLFSLALIVLQQGYEICTAIEKVNPQILSQLGACCEKCRNKILSCAEFAGCLVAYGVQDQLDKFKQLFSRC